MTRIIDVNIVNAFVASDDGGNPAGVVLDADSLSAAQKQAIAGKVGLSETAFVSKSQQSDFKLEFFTPTRQIAHCGHATIAVFSYLSSLGRITKPQSSKETIDGTRAIVLSGGMAFMEQKAPRYQDLGEPVGVATVMKSLGLTLSDVHHEIAPLVVNTGNSFMLIPLRDEKTLASLAPDLPAIAEISDRLDLIGYYAFTVETKLAASDAAARMFAPRYGIPEESATGMAAGPLACLLYDRMNVKKSEIVIEQGYLMQPPSPSTIFARLDVAGGAIRSLLVGGRALASKTIQVELD